MIRQYHTKKRGISLILCVSVMMILSVMAVTFARLMTYEQAAINNYVSVVDARFAAYAGIERVKAELWHQMVSFNNVDPRYRTNHAGIDFWYPYDCTSANYHLTQAVNGSQAISLTLDTTGAHSYSGVVGSMDATFPNPTDRLGRFEVNGNIYALKIVDPQGKINVNSHHSSVASHQIEANTVMNNMLVALAKECGINTSDQASVANALRPADNNPPPLHLSMEGVRQIIRNHCPYTAEANQLLFFDNLTVSSYINDSARAFNKSSNIILHPPLSNYGNYRVERRAPINVNTASVPVLAALIMGIKANIFMYNTNTVSDTEMYYGKTAVNGLEYEKAINLDLWRLEINFNQTQAHNIATLIRNRVVSQGPFETWGALESFLCNASEVPNANFPNSPLNPSRVVLTPGGDATTAWLSRPAYSKQWYQACRDALRANFNPNACTNFWNPDLAIYRAVTKADLFSTTGGNIAPGYTTELCLTCEGNADVICLGMITSRNGERTVASSVLRTNVRMCDVITHTTQQDFTSSTISGYPNFNNQTISYPEIYYNSATYPTNWNSNVDQHIGWVQPQTQIMNKLDNDLLYELMSTDYYRVDADLPGTISKLTLVSTDDLRMGNYTKDPTMPKLVNIPTTITDRVPNVMPDGILSRQQLFLAKVGTNYLHQNRYCTTNTITKNGAIVALQGRGKDSHNYYKKLTHAGVESKLANYKGGIEFYVKLDVPGDAEMMCGLLAWTQISEAKNGVKVVVTSSGTQITNIKFREGIQTYLFKTATGKLRLTRMYFAGLFDKDGNYFGAWAINDADKTHRKAYPKRDVIMDISNWAAHSWHHILIGWDDEKSVLKDSLYIVVDGGGSGKAKSAEYYLGSPALAQFCILNERAPLTSLQLETQHDMDGFFINGFYRRQYAKDVDSLTFHYDTVIQNVGNCTMDGLRTYYKDFNDGFTCNPRRYSSGNATYTNIIPITTDGYLGALTYTGYHPSTTATVTCTGRIRPNSSSAFTNSHVVANAVDAYAGGKLPIILPSNLVNIGTGQQLEYTLTFASDAMQCAVVDAVNVYILRLQSGYTEQVYTVD